MKGQEPYDEDIAYNGDYDDLEAMDEESSSSDNSSRRLPVAQVDFQLGIQTNTQEIASQEAADFQAVVVNLARMSQAQDRQYSLQEEVAGVDGLRLLRKNSPQVK